MSLYPDRIAKDARAHSLLPQFSGQNFSQASVFTDDKYVHGFSGLPGTTRVSGLGSHRRRSLTGRRHRAARVQEFLESEYGCFF
jgi:hypothetical protein